MDGELVIGRELTSQDGNKYKVCKLLGSGGQGEVYDVTNNGNHLALKWYYARTATPEQKRLLQELVGKVKPDDNFLWPEDFVADEQGKSYGYIMKLRPSNYVSIVDLMKRTAEPSFYILCKVAYNLTLSYNNLHNCGYCYKDISFGNLFFDPNTGDVLICDNDNVSPNGSGGSSVYGTPRFMAPEIVAKRVKPSRNTDLYSLSVLLFYIFMLNHPLEGKLEASIKCMDLYAMEKLYGTNPVFIFDPDDKSNRPLRGYQDNANEFWAVYPTQLKRLFTHAFTVGLKEPSKRITEKQWLNAFANLMCGIMTCSKCGCENFYDAEREKLGAAHICWNCNTRLKNPVKIIIDKNIVLLSTSNSKLYSHHINRDYDMSTIVGSVNQNPKNPNIWGIRNDSNENWTYCSPGGEQTIVAPGRSARIAIGAKIRFKNFEGIIE